MNKSIIEQRSMDVLVAEVNALIEQGASVRMALLYEEHARGLSPLTKQLLAGQFVITEGEGERDERAA